VVFGFLIDVPLLTITFVLLFAFRRRIASTIVRIPAPPILLALLTSIPLIIFEEQIDCQVSWCGKVPIPPTLPFLMIEIVVFCLILTYVHARSVRRSVLLFCVYGVAFELLVGGLVGASLSPVTLFFVVYVGLGYAFISLLPVMVLFTANQKAGKRGDAPENLVAFPEHEQVAL
jgi:hypothetical protein